MSAFIDTLRGLSLLDPWMLLLAVLLVPAIVMRIRRKSLSVLFAPGRFITRHYDVGKNRFNSGQEPDGKHNSEFAPFPVSWRVRCLWIPPFLQVVGLLLLVIAVARPVHRTPLPYETEGMDILLCLDTSSSMTAEDMDEQRTRLDVAQEAASRFIAQRSHDRIGLLCFARYPDLRCPLTLDHKALLSLLDEVVTTDSDSPEDATGIGTAVARAAQVIRYSTSPSKVLILFTDGEENVATDQTPDEIAPVHAGQLCRELGIRVYTIAAGIGAPDAQGEWRKIDTRQVRNLAERTGGKFFEARDAGAVAGVYSNIDQMEKVELKEPRYRIKEYFLPFLATALILLAVSRALRATVLEVLP